MIKNAIKKIDKILLFGILKKIRNKFDDQIKSIIHKRFVNKISNKTELKNYNFLNNDKSNELSQLCEKYGSDKGYIDFEKKNSWPWKPHTYSNVYNNLFNHCRENIKLVFECGIGTTDTKIPCNMSSNGKPGASLRVWRDYFYNAVLYGADIDPTVIFSEKRIKTFFVDQLDKKEIKKMWKSIDKDNFDLIIDDGLHEYEAAKNLFFESFHKLKKGGLYIIEDVSNTYFEKLFETLSNYNPEGIVLFDKKNFWYGNNLIIVRKN